MAAVIPMLNVASLSCERACRPLFSNLSFSVNPGEVLQVVGNNGAGKTTLLKILLGLYQDHEGEVHWSLDDYPLYVGHGSGVKDSLTARENLEWLCRLQALDIVDGVVDGGVDGAEDKIAAALDKVGLADFSDTLCGSLSQGQKKRVNLARLFALPGKCWILDEPMNTIDAEGVALLEEAIAAHIKKRGAVILASHRQLSIPAKLLALEPAR